MLLNKETDYAIRIVSFLSKQNNHITAGEISKNTGVTPKFTLKILHNLCTNNIVNSYKGKNGGYYLNKKPEEISLLDIIELFGSTQFANRCTNEGNCSNPFGFCEFKKTFDEATNYLNEHFGKVYFK